MVHHVILRTLKPELQGFSPPITGEKKGVIRLLKEKQKVLDDIKEGLEGLLNVLDCIVDIDVHVGERLDTSNCDLMLDSVFETEEDLHAYSTSPEHLTVANSKVRPYTIQRVCFEYKD